MAGVVVLRVVTARRNGDETGDGENSGYRRVGGDDAQTYQVLIG